MGNKRWLVSKVGLVVAAMLLACTAGASGWAQEKPSGSRPNIIVVLLDDVGFSDPAGFGGLAQMPAFDSVARGGLRFTNFNTTGMCSPTRASLLSGRNHHAVGFGRVVPTGRRARPVMTPSGRRMPHPSRRCCRMRDTAPQQ